MWRRQFLLLTVLALVVCATTRADDRMDLQAFAIRGDSFRDAGRWKDAVNEYDKALPLAIKLLGPDHEAVIQLITEIGRLHGRLNDFTKSRDYLQRALQLAEKKKGKHDPQTLTVAWTLASSYEATDNHEKAEPLRQQIVTGYTQRFGASHEQTASALQALGYVQTALGQYKTAEQTLLRSLGIREKVLGRNHLETAVSHAALAELYRVMKEFKKGEAAARKSLAIREDQLPKNHPEIASSWIDLANLLQYDSRQKEAAVLYEKALPIFEATYGAASLETSHVVNAMALNQHKMGRYEAAQSLYEHAIATQIRIAGKEHPATLLPRHNYAILLAAKEQYTEAAKAFTEVRQLDRQRLAQILPTLTETQQLTFLGNVDQRRMLYIPLTLGLNRRADTAFNALSAAWVLNGKAMSQQVLAEQGRLQRDSRNPALAPLIRQLTTVRTQLAVLSHGLNASLLAREQLAASEQELAKKLAQAGGQATHATWVELAEVRKHLPANSALIEIAKFEVIDFQSTDDKTRWKSHRYAAWIIRPTGDIQVVDLGEAKLLDDAIAAARKELDTAPATIRAKGEPDAEKQLHKPLATVAAQLLPPLMKHLDGVEQWIISPDGNLWLLPWEILPVEKGKYLGETKRVQYVLTGRDCLPAPQAKITQTPSVILADPDYNLSRDKAAAELKNLLNEVQPDGLARSTRNLVLGSIPRLPGTAVEAEAVAPRLSKYGGTEAKVFTGSQALEGVVKAAKNPRVLVLSTHGFFLPEQADGDVASKDKLENPLLRCGLLLAGCNDRKPASQGDDGVLTGLEIAATDLRGTELVVLSACETGLGDINNGEGVAGLRRVFHVAGAEHVLATLWQVPDLQSAQLMAAFFEHLSDGRTPSKALQQAQREMIQKRRDRFGAAHPYYWAAYTLTGPGK